MPTVNVNDTSPAKPGAEPGPPRIAGLEPLMTAEEVARLLGCSLSMIYKLRREGRLKSVKIGALHRFAPAAVRRFVQDSMGA